MESPRSEPVVAMDVVRNQLPLLHWGKKYCTQSDFQQDHNDRSSLSHYRIAHSTGGSDHHTYRLFFLVKLSYTITPSSDQLHLLSFSGHKASIQLFIAFQACPKGPGTASAALRPASNPSPFTVALRLLLLSTYWRGRIPPLRSPRFPDAGSGACPTDPSVHPINHS